MPRRKPKKSQQRKRFIPKVDNARGKRFARLCRSIMSKPQRST